MNESRGGFPIERRALGRTGARLSLVGMGGVVVTGTTQAQATEYVVEAFDRGVNYFDVAPRYGDAQERLGPALHPMRSRCFLACKTNRRSAAGAEAHIDESLKLLQTDYFDLYQLHALGTAEDDVERAFGPGGAMEAVVRAREAGKIRFIGFSAHSEAAALAAMDKFEFDTILFPLNYGIWHRGGFGPAVFERAREKGMGILAIKALSRAKWPDSLEPEERRWSKCWYEPLEDPEAIELHMRFTLNLPVTAMIPPGHWELFKIALETAEQGRVGPLGEEETSRLESMSRECEPLFASPTA